MLEEESVLEHTKFFSNAINLLLIKVTPEGDPVLLYDLVLGILYHTVLSANGWYPVRPRDTE
jgi:hypothetical protein